MQLDEKEFRSFVIIITERNIFQKFSKKFTLILKAGLYVCESTDNQAVVLSQSCHYY